jgi:predicted DNA-binding ribbon-helix-helix protein
MAQEPDDWQRLRYFTIAGKRTSVRLEDDFYDALREVAVRQGKTEHELVTSIAGSTKGNLASATRVYVLRYYRRLRATAL